MKYTSINISPLNLKLDTENPRFIIPPSATQKDIIEYLVENEEVIDLANSINKSSSLMIGERIIVYKVNNDYIVLEGNRRTCALKLLLYKLR